MRYRALGPITVEVDGTEVRLGGLRQRLVLAVLLSKANHVVSQDGLIDSVWAGDPPEAARATLQSYIYHLRLALGADAIVRRGEGYIIEANALTFDVPAFEERLDRGRNLLAADPAAARAALMEGLGLWFGTAYGGVDLPQLHAEIQRLDEMRVNAIETRIEADLALGRGAELVGELGSLVREHPLRERFWAQLMLALYRSGRQAEALRTYHKAREHLVEDLGIEPGAELQHLEELILNHDGSLVAEHHPPRPPNGEPDMVRGYELRDVLGTGEFGPVYRAYQPSIGREVALKVIGPEYANDATFVARFEREAQVVAGLEHPHILRLYDYWRDPAGAYLVMPLMRGGSLDQALRGGGWNLEPALRLLDQVGSALGHAHRRGVLHGNLHAGNVLLDEDGNAYLSDFGLAAPLDADTGGSSVSEEPTIRSDIDHLGALTYQLLTGIPFTGASGAARLDEARPDTPPALAAAVARATATEPGQRFAKVEDYLRAVRRATGADVVVAPDVVDETDEPIRNPYKGLRAFTEGDAVDFHGRATLVDDLMERVAAHRLVTVVGPSGSGKSSVVRAGLIPALRAGGLPGSRHWLITDMFPGSYPFEELEAALIRVAVRAPTGLREELSQPNGLLRVSKQILPDDDSTLLIVIDQFEELFSTVRSEETRRRFLDNLINVANDERSRIRLVTTIRADFLDRPLAYAEYAEAIADGIVTVGPPARDGLAQAVAAPARAVGLDLEPGLVGRIIADVEGQPGALPLLQHALTEMFSRRQGSALTIAGYEATGGVAGALGRRAEELYAGLVPAGRAAAREIFLRLVSVDELGTLTRRRARQSELMSLAVDRRGLDSVLGAFSRFRLLTFDRDPVTRGPTVEVGHEALLTEWSRLRDWIAEARESLVLARRVGESARDWIESHEDPSYLLRGARLEEMENWATQAGVVLTEDESRYIAAGVERRRAELDSTRRRRRRSMLALAGGLGVVSLLAVVAIAQREVAQDEARQARVRELAAASSSHLQQNRELALLVAVEAFDESIEGGGAPMPEAVSAMAEAVADWRLVSRFLAGAVAFPVATPDGSLVAVSSQQSPADIALFRADGSPAGRLPGPEHPGVAAWATAFHPDGDTVAVTYAAPQGDTFRSLPDGVPDVVIFDLASLSRVAEWDTDRGWANASYSPNGDVIGLSGDQEAHFVSSEDGTELFSFEASSFVGRPLFVDDTEAMVPVEGSGFASLSMADGSVVGHLEVPELNPAVTSMSASRTRLGFRAGDRLEVVDLATGEMLFQQQAPSVLSLALDPEGTRIAYSGFDPNIYVSGIEVDRAQLTLSGILENVHSLVFVDSERLLSYGEDALMWDVSPEGLDGLGGVALSEPQWGYQISPDEQSLAYAVSTNNGGPIGDPRDGLRLVDVATGEEMVVTVGEWQSVNAGIRLISEDFTMVGSLTQSGESTVRRFPGWELVRRFDDCRTPLAISPDKRQVVLSGWGCDPATPHDPAESTIVDLESGAEVLTLPLERVWSAEFNPEGVFDGGRFLVATDQVIVEVWDTATGESVGRLERSEHPEFGNVLAMAFDPTGRYVVGGTTSGMVWVVDVERVLAGADMADALVFSRQAHTGAAPVPALNGDGIVATAGFDGWVRLWDLHIGDLVYEFRSDIEIPVVRFSPDGSEILYPNGLSIRRMPVDPHGLRALADDLLTRDFLPDECARYGDEGGCD